jgi:hypothetical protein
MVYNKKWFEENKAARHAYKSTYYKTHKKEMDAKQKAWVETHRERSRELCRESYARNKDKRLSYDLQRKFGITKEQKVAMLNKQFGLCSICFTYVHGSSGHVDHNHDTKKLREILCSKCNTMIGLAKENIGTLLNAAEYLKKHSTVEAHHERVYLS